MKINTETLDIERIGDEIKIEASIDKANLSFLFEIMSSSFYSNPIGSMIREITSNCLDSHIEANITDPIIIEKEYYEEDDCYYITFKDVGVGLSPERIMTIYMNYFSSTKRDTDSLIGCFGLGSKTPLSYQDQFYIETVYNGIKYEYIYHKGEEKPELDSIHGFKEIDIPLGEQIYIPKYEPLGIKTDKGNGTIIKVEICDGDINRIEEELKKQLCYFDNVYFKNFDVQNDYKIYEGNNFKYKNINQYLEEMHIVLGNVSYPIDYKLLDIKPIKISVGLKFEIGTLFVTPNRESIRYKTETKKIIKDKIKLCIKELRDKYEKSNPLIQDIFQYITSRTARSYIKLSEEDKLYIPVEYVPTISKFNKFDKLYIPTNPFFMYELSRVINYNSETANNRSRYYHHTVYDLIYRRNNFVYTNYINNSSYKNAYVSQTNEIYIIKRKKLNYKKLCGILGLYIYERYERYGNPEHNKYFDENKDGTRKIPLLGKAKLIKDYLNYIDDVVQKKVNDYDKVIVPEEWIEQYKEDKKQTNAARLRKLNKKIIIKLCLGQRIELKISELADYKLVIYKFLHEKDIDLYKIMNLIKCRKSFDNLFKNGSHYNTHNISNKYKIFIINVGKTNFPLIKNLPNLVHATKIHEEYMFQKMFRDYGALIKINKSNYLNLEVEHVSNYYHNKILQLSRFYQKYEDNRYIMQENLHYILKVCDERNLHNHKIERILNEIKKVYSKLEITEYINYNIPIQFKKLIFSNLKTLKLNEELYSIKINNKNDETTINDSEEDRS